MPGPSTSLRKNLYIRLIEMGGEQTKIALVGVSEWDCNKGGYKVVLQYQMSTPWPSSTSSWRRLAATPNRMSRRAGNGSASYGERKVRQSGSRNVSLTSASVRKWWQGKFPWPRLCEALDG